MGGCTGTGWSVVGWWWVVVLSRGVGGGTDTGGVSGRMIARARDTGGHGSGWSGSSRPGWSGISPISGWPSVSRCHSPSGCHGIQSPSRHLRLCIPCLPTGPPRPNRPTGAAVSAPYLGSILTLTASIHPTIHPRRTPMPPSSLTRGRQFNRQPSTGRCTGKYFSQKQQQVSTSAAACILCIA